MHELSIAQSLVELACEASAREKADRVRSLHVRIGAISGVVSEALRFSFDLVAEGTCCEGATLEIEDVELTAMCAVCCEVQVLPDISHLVCPTCGTPTYDILTGRELDLISLEVDSHVPAHS